jgi:hypothetical protein
MEIARGIVTFQAGGHSRRISAATMEFCDARISVKPTSQAVCLPHSIAQNAIEWATLVLFCPPALLEPRE